MKAGDVAKHRGFLRCDVCGHKTQYRRAINGFYTPLRGKREAKVILVPCCKSHPYGNLL